MENLKLQREAASARDNVEYVIDRLITEIEDLESAKAKLEDEIIELKEQLSER